MNAFLLVMLALEVAAGLAVLRLSRRHIKERAAREALKDPVTGLPPRELFEGRAEVALARARRHGYRVALLVVNLDRFSNVNDRLGYQKGDEILAAAAGRLQSCLREEDTVARLGGDEFTVLLEQVDDDVGAARVARRMLRSLQKPLEVEGDGVFVGASIGVAVSDESADSPEALLRSAALAMQRAKELGKGRYEMFEPAMMARASRRLGLEGDLRHAVDEGQLRLVYEPEVLLHSGEVTSVEALLRWDHPTHGLLAPLTFIPLAEETGLIVPIGLWVLEEACRATRRLHAARPDLPVGVSVNVSARQLERPQRFAADVSAILTATGLAPELLTLEITESVLMEHSSSAKAAVQALRDLGVEVAIDDFGTGYSSLSYLKHFPFSALKLDQSFVQGQAHPVDSAIVGSVIQLAEHLSMKVTAEGIETFSQLRELRTVGCRIGQGFYLSRPVDEDVLPLLVDGSLWRAMLWPEGHGAEGPDPSGLASSGVRAR